MEPRLTPLNAVLALLRDDGAWFSDLAAQGLRLHGLEVGVQSTPGAIRVDVVAYRVDPPLVVLFEIKKGASLDERQTRGYANATVAGMRQRGALPSELHGLADVEVCPAWVTLEPSVDAVRRRLTELQVSAPILGVGAGRAFFGGPLPNGLTPFDHDERRRGLPPARVRLDPESAVGEYVPVMLQAIGAALARREAVIELDVVARQVMTDWVCLSPRGRRRIVERCRKAVEHLRREGWAEELHLESSNEVAPRVRLLRTPADADPRGAPQAWQRLQRMATRALAGDEPLHVEDPAQLSFDDLAGVDEGDEGDLDQPEEGGADVG